MKTRGIYGLGIFQILIGVGAVGGGLGLVLDPTGESLGMTAGWLAGSPFSTFLIPGLFLFMVNGLGTLLGSVATFKIHKLAGEIAMALGAVMVLWIIIQVAIIGYTSFLQPLYFVVGLLELLGGRWLRGHLRKVAVPDIADTEYL